MGRKGGIRNERVSPQFRRLLLQLRPDLRQEPLEVQQSIAHLLFASNLKNRQHKTEAGHMTISYQEIYQRFGREGGIELLTEKYRIFETPGGFSTKQRTTRAFKVVEDLAEESRKYFARWTYRQRHRPKMTDKKGRQIHKLDAAIDSKDADGRDAVAEGKDKVANFVPVEAWRVKAYCKKLISLKGPQCDFFSSNDPLEIDAMLDAVGRMMDSTQTHLGEHGLIHRYQEKDSGRLYGQGMNLQNTHREIKAVVLAGQWEYDIENCHFAILQQLAGQYGLDLPAVGHYLAYKQMVRHQIASDVGIEVGQVKTCLVALMYGARDSHRGRNSEGKYQDAIPKTIGKPAALRLYKHPLWEGLKRDVAKARLRIIRKWPRSRQRLQNASGKWISERANKKQILAHLLQGVEAKMLEVVRLIYPDTLSLMQHDGFNSPVRLDTKRIEEAITEATGFVVSMEEKKVQIPEHLGIERH